MSLFIREAVRELLSDVESDLEGPIERGSPFWRLQQALRRDEIADAAPAALPSKTALHLVALADALRAYRKPGGHFAGCTADKTGRLCADVCRRAQLALTPDVERATSAVTEQLLAAIRVLEHDRTALRGRVRQERRKYARVLKRAEAETGFVLRSPGRPRKGEASRVSLGTSTEVDVADRGAPTRNRRPATKATRSSGGVTQESTTC